MRNCTTGLLCSSLSDLDKCDIVFTFFEGQFYAYLNLNSNLYHELIVHLYTEYLLSHRIWFNKYLYRWRMERSVHFPRSQTRELLARDDVGGETYTFVLDLSVLLLFLIPMSLDYFSSECSQSTKRVRIFQLLVFSIRITRIRELTYG